MAYYESNSNTNNEQWPTGQKRQPSWEHQTSNGRPGANPPLSAQQSQAAEPNAFAAQFEEIERATDNLSRSGKWYPGAPGSASGRRDSSSTGRFDHSDRQTRHQSNGGDFDGGRQGPGGPHFQQGQRFPSRQSEAEQILHAKRRMAAQRERELRNYHQEQQYNRTGSSTSAKPERALSPNTMSEDERRDLIARQHRALYGDNSSLYTPEGSSNRAKSQDVRAGGRGPSPLPYDAYGQAQPGADASVQMASRERTESTASPVGIDAQQARAQTTSPGATSPPHQSGLKGVAPIGTRPPQQVPSLVKRATTPLTSSSLSYGYTSDTPSKDDRAPSTVNTNLSGDKGVNSLGGSWSANSGVWGKSNQASVWG